ncbi:hypothetical protein NDU88_000490 [Pleurodeles waltl]|uniref:Uncharacterized protein n=1 Tax=Pleurodeles waltl TaxID=8319 RepID=A0AAV7WJH7_PLEWA|nr:hypothetical protein NDU88_000490 [Pleurodeles waltl]
MKPRMGAPITSEHSHTREASLDPVLCALPHGRPEEKAKDGGSHPKACWSPGLGALNLTWQRKPPFDWWTARPRPFVVQQAGERETPAQGLAGAWLRLMNLAT